MSDPAPLSLWVIVQSAERSDTFVATEWLLKGGSVTGGPGEFSHATLDGVRAMLPSHLVRIAPDPADADKIVESWV